MRNKHVIVAVVLTYLVLSFVPSLLLTNFIGRGKQKGQ
jgi:multisubunit Na+/H+ antiporter MnhF subunit